LPLTVEIQPYCLVKQQNTSPLTFKAIKTSPFPPGPSH